MARLPSVHDFVLGQTITTGLAAIGHPRPFCGCRRTELQLGTELFRIGSGAFLRPSVQRSGQPALALPAGQAVRAGGQGRCRPRRPPPQIHVDCNCLPSQAYQAEQHAPDGCLPGGVFVHQSPRYRLARRARHPERAADQRPWRSCRQTAAVPPSGRPAWRRRWHVGQQDTHGGTTSSGVEALAGIDPIIKALSHQACKLTWLSGRSHLAQNVSPKALDEHLPRREAGTTGIDFLWAQCHRDGYPP